MEPITKNRVEETSPKACVRALSMNSVIRSCIVRFPKLGMSSENSDNTVLCARMASASSRNKPHRMMLMASTMAVLLILMTSSNATRMMPIRKMMGIKAKIMIKSF